MRVLKRREDLEKRKKEEKGGGSTYQIYLGTTL